MHKNAEDLRPGWKIRQNIGGVEADIIANHACRRRVPKPDECLSADECLSVCRRHRMGIDFAYPQSDREA